MLNIYLTRHGETEWNKENRLQGSMNSKLTNNGIKNAIKLGERLNNIDLNAIYSSPSERALQTAQYIKLGREIPIYTVEDLKEIHFGHWEGKTKEEIVAIEDYNSEFRNFWNSPHTYNHKPHNGEGLDDFKQRVEVAVRRVISESINGNILIVTHAVVIRAIMSFTMNIPTDRMWDPPFIHGTSLSILNWDGDQFNYEMIGDTSHFI